jgi:diguanylate cyclase (GGDEF)-like protein
MCVPEPTVVVLRGEDFATPGDLLRARDAIAAPVLFRVRAGELDAVLAAMRDTDDVCLEGDPPGLVEHRVRALARRAGRDLLTGLANRTAFDRALIAAPPAALLVINLDHFKRLNDTYGHLAGDEVLKAAAARVAAAAPADAVVARTGGDVFAVALASHHDPRRVAGAIRAAFHAGPFLEGAQVTASIGLVVRTGEPDHGELLRRAEGALYAAKARGRDRIVDHAEREREARARDGDVEVEGFEEMTRVLAERVADVISWRGRKVFQGLREQADLDALTGLFSRRYLDRRLPFELEQAHAQGRPLSIGLLDVDHFGRVNKEHGWPTGDRILADAAARVRAALRASDWAARYGGEEICIVLDGVDLDAARAALERVRASIASTPFPTTQGAPLAITASIGAAELGPDEALAELLERASARLLEAKRGGRDRVRG